MKALLPKLVLLCALLASGCTTIVARAPAPEAQLDVAKPYGVAGPLLRSWGDTVAPGVAQAATARYAAKLKQIHGDRLRAGRKIEAAYLALSGGGPDGAFGAGFLKGWTARGDRPAFRLVTGVSTGAVISIFAFLGPDYDDVLEELYTDYSTGDLLRTTVFSGILGGSALSDTKPYRRLIARYIDADVVAALAAAHRRGRTLMIATTNLDAGRPVIWNVSGIAATGHGNAAALIRDVVAASSAIPAAFPPVMIPVEIDGKTYDEMHVDGGASQQVAVLSPQFTTAELDAILGDVFDRKLYVIVNNSLQKAYEPVRPRLAPIAARALSSLLSGSGTGDLYRLYAIAERDRIRMQATWIPKSFKRVPAEAFDKAYMRELFDLGFEMGLNRPNWRPQPPGLQISR